MQRDLFMKRLFKMVKRCGRITGLKQWSGASKTEANTIPRSKGASKGVVDGNLLGESPLEISTLRGPVTFHKRGYRGNAGEGDN